eukprot:6160299-Alexandrium_andersonii.AAC.1
MAPRPRATEQFRVDQRPLCAKGGDNLHGKRNVPASMPLRKWKCHNVYKFAINSKTHTFKASQAKPRR